MKKLFFLAISLLMVTAAFAQSNKWSSITYTYSKGPVSPEYQYNYSIDISPDGNGKLVYTKASKTNEYSFQFGKKGRKKLNSALNKSKVFTVSPEDMIASDIMMGGPLRGLSITKWQSPMLDARPEVITVPAHVNETYQTCINQLYETIENLVPNSIWNKAMAQ
ncbi:MAG: hypothetical protein ABIY50_10380 [Ignavibacteria bacterium]